jgi:hypothetical protein
MNAMISKVRSIKKKPFGLRIVIESHVFQSFKHPSGFSYLGSRKHNLFLTKFSQLLSILSKVASPVSGEK